ncbi:MAG: CBS domain-containing protein [Deltaproteobacteria bacterium]|nr:CBS domain-containing protein [Deltaproteobacteria bacterium]
MLAKDWMTSTVITVDVNKSMQDAMNLLKKNEIRMLPVMKGGSMVGIVTDRDLKNAQASDTTTLDIHELLYLISKIEVKDIMSEPPVTVPIDYTVEETAKQLLENKISGAPVVDSSGRIAGAITQTDMFNAMISLTGVGIGGCPRMPFSQTLRYAKKIILGILTICLR